jgi:C4-dicarboxylate-specific signal transduction histidine kinase
LVIGPCAGSCGTAAFRRETVVVSDIATDPLWAEFRATALSYGLKACWSKPVISTTGVVLGTFAMYYDEVRTPDDRDLRLIERATHIAQIAIERERTQDSLRKSQANLAHVTRVTTMGELTASIAHEVNQPLAGVVTNANACIRWLAGNSPDLHEAREALRRIVRDGNRASDVIGRIRGLLKKGEPARTRLDINPVIQEIIELVRGEMIQSKVSLQTELVAGLPLVSADRVQLQQVLLNLITNALDALRPVKDRPRFLRIRTDKPDARAVRVAMQDTGVGVDPQQAEHLFQAFFTTKPNGLGMGLSISRSIVEAHGGRLWATPNDGPGVTFQFTLPVEEGAAG